MADDRKEFSAAGRFPPGAQAVCGSYAETIGKFPFDSATYVVMVTRGHLTDLECVRAVLAKKYRYAGFIGSERKAKLLREQLRSDGFDQEKIDALHAPIGLDIKAETPGGAGRCHHGAVDCRAAKRRGSEVYLCPQMIRGTPWLSQQRVGLVDHVAVAAEIAQQAGSTGFSRRYRVTLP